MKKSMIFLLVALIVSTISLGTVGILHKKTPIKEFTITYKYYLNNEEINSLPENSKVSVDVLDENNQKKTITEDEYTFKEYKCDNNVIGTWNKEKWEFIPNKTSDSTCSLYFESNFCTVELNVNNATMINPTSPINKTKKNMIMEYILEPNEGFMYEKVTCTNEAKGFWNQNDKKLVINDITKNTKCEVNFIIDKYKIVFSANHGKISEVEKTAKFGEKVSTTVKPQDNYSFNKIECTNNQQATYDEKTHTITIDKLTNETQCTIDFIPNKFDVTIEVKNGTVNNKTKNVTINSNASFNISNNPGYTLKNPNIVCTNGQSGILSNSLFRVNKVTNNTVCTITLEKEN